MFENKFSIHLYPYIENNKEKVSSLKREYKEIKYESEVDKRTFKSIKGYQNCTPSLICLNLNPTIHTHHDLIIGDTFYEEDTKTFYIFTLLSEKRFCLTDIGFIKFNEKDDDNLLNIIHNINKVQTDGHFLSLSEFDFNWSNLSFVGNFFYHSNIVSCVKSKSRELSDELIYDITEILKSLKNINDITIAFKNINGLKKTLSIYTLSLEDLICLNEQQWSFSISKKIVLHPTIDRLEYMKFFHNHIYCLKDYMKKTIVKKNRRYNHDKILVYFDFNKFTVDYLSTNKKEFRFSVFPESKTYEEIDTVFVSKEKEDLYYRNLLIFL